MPPESRTFIQFVRSIIFTNMALLRPLKKFIWGVDEVALENISQELAKTLSVRAEQYFSTTIQDALTEEMFGELTSIEGPLDVPPEKMWIAERDACRHCLAYQGEFVKLNEEFAEGLTYGDKPIAPSAYADLLKPPLHPHCRCEIIPYDHARDLGPITQSEALKREAQRSILRGWSLESESQASRLRAAERLLRQDPEMPKSVKQIAERAIRRGGFVNR